MTNLKGEFCRSFGTNVLESIIRDPVLFVNASLPHFSTPGQSRSPNVGTLRLTLFRGYLCVYCDYVLPEAVQ